ncbi:Uncharacterised protein [Legionella busanensis]|uniref:Uncharacterized protein n=1 Tax=Legionella busanensis TaxID=190655 RepID=A0A378JIV4_9GAMM|nr:hypothetical protein [Legionella busanensis]STX51084.1 Uncharacterised protein [Legionella busanensis]
MQKVTSICFLGLTYLSVGYANANAEFNLQEDKSAQSRCIQQVLADCTQKCEQDSGKNCIQLCSETATNECRQAGQ